MIRRVKAPKYTPSLSALLTGILLLILPVFAYLQYVWLGKVSEGEREQMKANLERSAAQFGDSFDREIGRVYAAFGPEASESVEDPREGYALVYARWLESSPVPELVEELYLTGADGRQSWLERLNPDSRRFEAVEWPEELESFRTGLHFENRRTAQNVEVFIRTLPRPVDASVPALFAPLGISHPNMYAIVKLHADFIGRTLLPSLIETYFGAGGDYNMTILGGKDGATPVFSTAHPPMTAGDVERGFFTPRFAEINFLRRPAVVAAGHGAGQQTVQLRVLQGIAQRREIVGTFAPASEAGWRLIVTHRAGSLDAAVGQVRRRNLAIGGGILALLGGSVAMLLFSSRRAQRLARQQMEFVSSVSHELRTPLAVICSAGENLADGVVVDSTQTQQYGAVVRAEGRRLTDMVEQILDFAAAETGRKNYKLQPAKVGEIVQSAIDACGAQIRENGFVVETRLDAGDAVIMADKPALTRAVQNLLSNALKYSGASRWIGIRAGAEPETIWIVVEDRGGGIPPADLPHIFEPFYRGREVVDAQIKGSGLGLRLVQQIVEAHGGSVRVLSSTSAGTAFRIDIPLPPQGRGPQAAG